MTFAPDKNEVTKIVREAAVADFEAQDLKVRRPTRANAYVEFEQVFVCFNVQHTQWKTDESLCFCVNYGVMPKVMFHENWSGYGGKYPRELDCVFRDRLDPKLNNYDWWWDVENVGDLTCVLKEVRQAANLVETEVLPRLSTAAECLENQNIAGRKRASPMLELLEEWRGRIA